MPFVGPDVRAAKNTGRLFTVAAAFHRRQRAHVAEVNACDAVRAGGDGLVPRARPSGYGAAAAAAIAAGRQMHVDLARRCARLQDPSAHTLSSAGCPFCCMFPSHGCLEVMRQTFRYRCSSVMGQHVDAFAGGARDDEISQAAGAEYDAALEDAALTPARRQRIESDRLFFEEGDDDGLGGVSAAALADSLQVAPAAPECPAAHAARIEVESGEQDAIDAAREADAADEAREAELDDAAGAGVERDEWAAAMAGKAVGTGTDPLLGEAWGMAHAQRVPPAAQQNGQRQRPVAELADQLATGRPAHDVEHRGLFLPDSITKAPRPRGVRAKVGLPRSTCSVCCQIYSLLVNQHRRIVMPVLLLQCLFGFWFMCGRRWHLVQGQLLLSDVLIFMCLCCRGPFAATLPRRTTSATFAATIGSQRRRQAGQRMMASES